MRSGRLGSSHPEARFDVSNSHDVDGDDESARRFGREWEDRRFRAIHRNVPRITTVARAHHRAARHPHDIVEERRECENAC
jgi:hypothetical protein